MEDSLFSINNFNIVQDEENYYFFRALNMADNSDIEQEITMPSDGKIERIRTDRERFDGETKYTEDSSITLEEVYDHIKMHYRKDTNCVSLTSNANIAINYGRGSYKDKYVMIKIPKKEFGEQTIEAGQYMLQELYLRIMKSLDELQEDLRSEILDIFSDIDVANETKELQEIIARRYTAQNGELNPSKAHPRKGIIYSTPKARISSYQSLSKEQLLEVNKVYAKLAVLENEEILKHVIPHSSNSKLRETIGNAFSSSELIHYGEIKQEEIIEIPKEVVDLFALIQQIDGIDKSKVEEIKRALLVAIQSGKEIPQLPEIDFSVKDNISIEEMYEITDGKVEYGKANSILKNMFYLSKSRQNAIALSNVLSEILGNNSGFEDIIQYIRENGFRVEPEIISRKSGKGVKLSESVNLNLQKEEQPLVDEIRKLSSEELDMVLQNGGLYNAQDIITRTFSNVRDNEEIDKSRYYAEAIISQYNWQDIGIEEFKTSERNELITRLQEKNCVKIYEKLRELGIEESQIPTVLLNIATREVFYEQYENGNLEELLNKRQDVLQNNINIEVVERFLGYYDIENTGIRLKDYQQRAYDNIDKIFEDKNFAQVILPTGAGKSFVALAQMQKYAIEHPNEKMLYLAPQDEILSQIKKYIVNYVHGKKGTVGKTDIDKIIAEVFPNITFETYSGLLAKRGQEIIKDQYGMIVLDELHRTGAKEWEGKIDTLLANQTDNTKVFGITATPTRDVDGRDMANETAKKLGYTDEEIKQRKHLASNMTLENAIRMGYVVNPKLVYCKYDLISSGKMDELRAKIDDIEDETKRAEELQKYNELRQKLNKEIDAEIGEEARKKLEDEARRNLDSGIGKEEILRQNVKKGGKYIVFIPVTDQGEIEDEDGNRIGAKTGEDKILGYQEYLSKVFEGTDITPQLHSLLGSYSKDKNKEELKAFESDKSEDTKFMVVMNKANEGLHIDGVDGIIWFRALDENSRILYLQQLGRAIYALDEDNPLPDDKRPVVIDLANNSLTVKIEKEFKEVKPIDDLEALTIVIEWINEHDGMIPNRESSNKQEQHYYAVLRRIQVKYSKYLDDFDNFSELDDEEKHRIQEIIDLASETDLWDMDLPPIPKTRGSKEEFDPFTVEGVLKDYIKLDDEINDLDKIDDIEIAKQYIAFLKAFGKKPSPTFRRNGIEIKKLIEMTPEQRDEKRLYSRWRVNPIRNLVEKKLKNSNEDINSEYIEVVEEITELMLQIESKENIEKIQEYITFLEVYHRKPQVCFKKRGRQLSTDELTESQLYEKRLGSRWRDSEIKRILDTYENKPISDVPQYYRDIILKLRDLGEYGKSEKKKIVKREKPVEEEILEFLNKYNRMPLGAIFRDNRRLTTAEMNEDEKKEVALYGQWKSCKVKKYIEMELSEVPDKYRRISSVISQKISEIKEYNESVIARKYIEFLSENMRVPSNTVTRNNEQLSVSEMTDEERCEINLANSYRKSKIKKAFVQFEKGEIDDLPPMWKEIYNQINSLVKKINVIEKTKIAKEYIEFIEKYGRYPRQNTSGKKRLKKHEKSDEQLYEESLGRRWSTSDIKTIFDEYIEHPNEELPQEYREVIYRLIELGINNTEEMTGHQMICVDKLRQLRQQRDNSKIKNEQAKELEEQVSEQLKKRGKSHEEQ